MDMDLEMEMTFNTIFEAYEYAEGLTARGFEVSIPKSFDGVTFTIVFNRD